MKITIESTHALVDLVPVSSKHSVDRGPPVDEKGAVVPARIWEGTTESGVPVVVFVTRISPQTHDLEANARFAAEQPSFEPFVGGVPLRLVL